MAKIKRILLTGDDGYNSLGTRLLAHFLKSNYELTIVGTLTQQSAVGGKLSLATGFTWGKTQVDGVTAFWVDGTPADAMEFATDYFMDEAFDLILSGINWGANLGSALFASGTVNAPLRGLATNLAPHAIAFSWDLPPEFYFFHHDIAHGLEEYLQYPGELIVPILHQCIAQDFYSTPLINVNFPQKPAQLMKITHLLADATKIYEYGPKITGDEGQFIYKGGRVYDPNLDPLSDVKAVTDGFVSVTPCKFDILADDVYRKFAGEEVLLK